MTITPEKQNKNSENNNPYLKYSGLGIQMGVIIGAGCYGGYKLDQYAKSEFPVWTIVLSLTAFVLALYWVYKQVNK